jgi:hypothetical protein
MWWHTPAIPTLRRLRKEDFEFKVSLSYYMIRCCLKRKKKQPETEMSGKCESFIQSTTQGL